MWRLRIEDILESVQNIGRFTKDMSLEDLTGDEKTVDAVVRNISVIDEATRHIPEEIRERYPDVLWSEMRGMRNVVVHEYASVSIRIVWQTARRNLPPLVPILRRKFWRTKRKPGLSYAPNRRSVLSKELT